MLLKLRKKERKKSKKEIEKEIEKERKKLKKRLRNKENKKEKQERKQNRALPDHISVLEYAATLDELLGAVGEVLGVDELLAFLVLQRNHLRHRRLPQRGFELLRLLVRLVAEKILFFFYFYWCFLFVLFIYWCFFIFFYFIRFLFVFICFFLNFFIFKNCYRWK